MRSTLHFHTTVALLGLLSLAAPPARGQARFTNAALQAALRDAGAQAPSGAAARQPGAQAPPPQAEPQTRRLTMEEAVKLALENNLGIQISRFDPQVEDLTVLQAQAAWSPTLTNTLQSTSTDSPNNSFLAGGQGLQDDGRPRPQHLRRRADAAVGQAATTSAGTARGSPPTTPSPPSRRSCARRCRSACTQPLVRGFSIDNIRQQVQAGAEEPRDRRRPAAADRRVHAAGRAQRLLESGLRASRRCACSSSRSSWRRSRCATRARASRSAPRRRSTSSRPNPKSPSAKRR